MKFQDLLNERATSILYHLTKLQVLPSILANNELKLTAGVGRNDPEKIENQKGKWWYLSTTRTKLGDYTVHGVYTTGVVLVLNGDWFNQKYSARPIDYWERMWLSTHGNPGIGKESQRHREAEDRIQSSTPSIPLPENITDAIPEIHILWNEEKAKVWGQDQFDKMKPWLRKSLILAKQRNVPTYVYGNKQDWLMQNKAKALPLSSLISTLSGEPTQSRMWASSVRDEFEPWRELYFKNKYKQLSKDAKSLAYNIKFHSDMARGLEASIHNEKRKHNPNLTKLLGIFSKLGITTPDEYVALMKKKWTQESVHEALLEKYRIEEGRKDPVFDECYQYALRLFNLGKEEGNDVELIQAQGYKGDGSNADMRWKELPQSYWTHYLVRFGDTVVDPTAGQFTGAGAERYPVGRLKELWDKLFSIQHTDRQIAESLDAEPLNELAPEPATINNVKYDSENGKGAVPYNQEVDYKGYAVIMKPYMFLHLAHSIGEPKESLKFLKQHIQNGGSIGPPWLQIDLGDRDPKTNQPSPDFVARVVGHEGRHRAKAIAELYGDDVPMLVHLFFPGYRAKELTPEIRARINKNIITQYGLPLHKGPFWKDA